MNLSEVKSTQQQIVRDGFITRRIDLSVLKNMTNPVLSIDHFEMTRPTFPPHPHAGFSAVTYMLNKSPGTFINRDSLGDTTLIHPGDLHWTLAGSGMMHEEVPTKNGVTCEGLQIFVNLSSKSKMTPPKAFHVNSQDAPVVVVNEVEIKLLSGNFNDFHAPFVLPENVDFFDIKSKGNGSLDILIKPNQGGLIYVLEGNVKVTDPNTQKLGQGQYIGFGTSAESRLKVDIEAGSQFVFLSGIHSNETLYFSGPFILNTQEEAELAIARFKKGEMGRLE
jgi:redox-sensitive bicupin YhaK (pirin superfamily)